MPNPDQASETPVDAGDAGAGSLVRFQPTPRMSTYIVAFAVGEFEAVRGTGPRGIPVSVYTTPGAPWP